MIFGREPAAIAAVVKTIIALASLTVLNLTADQQAALNGIAAVVLGIIVAWQVSAEKALPLLVGLVEGGLLVAVAFGFNVSQPVQAAALAATAAVVALITRDRVEAPVDVNGVRR